MIKTISYYGTVDFLLNIKIIDWMATTIYNSLMGQLSESERERERQLERENERGEIGGFFSTVIPF